MERAEMTDSELLADIKHKCRQHAHWGCNPETHRLASEIAKAIERHEAEREMGSDEKVSEVAHA
jgi:hypothetical protein